MRRIGRGDQWLAEEDFLALESGDVVTLPILLGIAIVPLEPDAGSELVKGRGHD